MQITKHSLCILHSLTAEEARAPRMVQHAAWRGPAVEAELVKGMGDGKWFGLDSKKGTFADAEAVASGRAPLPSSHTAARETVRAKIEEAVIAPLSCSVRRRRSFDEFDGDEYDRDRGAWSMTRRENSPATGRRVARLAVNINVSYSTTGADLSTATGLICGLIDALETSGVPVELIGAVTSRAAGDYYLNHWTAKSAGDVLDINALSRQLGPWFFRTNGFRMIQTIPVLDSPGYHYPAALAPLAPALGSDVYVLDALPMVHAPDQTAALLTQYAAILAKAKEE